MSTKEAFSYKNSKGQVYYLHTQETVMRGGRKQRIYFFAKDIRHTDKAEPLASLPEGYVVGENSRTGLPLLKKSAA